MKSEDRRDRAMALDSRLVELENVKARALASIGAEQLSVENLSSIASACASVAAAKKGEIEATQLERVSRSELVRFWVPVLGSLLSVFILGGSLFFQSKQFTKSIEQQTNALRAQIDANEDTQWREAIRIMAERGLVNNAAGVALLGYFVNSPRHGKEARDLGVVLLANMTNEEGFRKLLQTVIDPANQAQLSDIVRVNRLLSIVNTELTGDVKAIEASRKRGNSRYMLVLSSGDKPQSVPIGFAEGQRRGMLNEVIGEQVMATKVIGEMLKARGSKNPPLDLSDCTLIRGNLAKANLSGANLTNTNFYEINLDNADLSGATASAVGTWEDTAWWRVARISQELLDTLRGADAFNTWRGKDGRYLGDSEKVFATDMARLASSK